MKKLILSFIVSVVALGASARTEDVTLWRGETFTRILHDYVKVGVAPDGFEVKTGVAKEVRYLTRPLGTHYSSFADRVEWGSADPGVKVLSVTVPTDAKPGVYYAGDVKITVIDRVLPPAKEWKYYLDLWQHPWAVARYNNVPPFSPAHYAAMKPLWEMLAGAGAKALTVSLLDRPWNHQCYDAYGTMVRHIKRKDGSWTFDYRLLDEYVAFGRRCGLGPDIACYTMCPWDYEVSWEDEEGRRQAVKARPGTPEFKEYWGAFLVDFEKHMKAKGWLDNTYIAMDERSPEDVMNIVTFINEMAPGLKVFLAGNRPPSQFKGIRLDNCCFGLSHLTDELIAEAASRRAQGMVTTFYVCCGPAYPNTMCHNEIEEAFWLGVYPAMSGLDGFIRGAWNSWPQDPMNDASYTGIGWGWKAGDTYLVYPNGAPSLRFLELRNGIVAAEKIRLLRAQGLFAAELDALAKKFDRKKAIKNNVDFFALRAQTQKLVNRP
jgi:hypothetical protein